MERIRRKLIRGRTEPWEDIRDELNRMLTGWVNYFWFGTPAQTFRDVDRHVTERVRNFLRRRHKEPRGTARFGYHEVHSKYGVVEVQALLRTHAFA